MRELEFLTGHVTFKLCYNQIYQLETTSSSYSDYPIKNFGYMFLQGTLQITSQGAD